MKISNLKGLNFQILLQDSSIKIKLNPFPSWAQLTQICGVQSVPSVARNSVYFRFIANIIPDFLQFLFNLIFRPQNAHTMKTAQQKLKERKNE